MFVYVVSYYDQYKAYNMLTTISKVLVDSN